MSRELDAEVAEKVMGWKRGRRYGNGNGEWIVEGSDRLFPLTWDATPRFSDDIKAAWEVVSALISRGMWLTIESGRNGDTFCAVFRRGKDLAGTSGFVESAPLAICLAAICLASLSTDNTRVASTETRE